MNRARYYVFDADLPDGGKVKVWVDGDLKTVRPVDAETFKRLSAIWKSKSVLLLVVMMPASIIATLLYLLDIGTIETLLYVAVGALVVDMGARIVLSHNERRAIGGLRVIPVPIDDSAEMAAAVLADDRARLRAVAGQILAQAE